MYILFTSVPLVGEANPLLRQAQELQRRGHRVAYAGARDMQAHVAAEAPTIPFIDLGPLGSVADRIRRAQRKASRDASFARGGVRILQSLWEVWPSMYDGVSAAIAADRPDVVVGDVFSTGGITAADAAGVPCVMNNPTLLGVLPLTLLPPADHLPFMFSKRSRHAPGVTHRLTAPLLRRVVAKLASVLVGRRLNRLRAGRGLPAIRFRDLHRTRQILVNLDFGLEYERPLPSNVAMVGGMLEPRLPALPRELDAWLSNGPPVVFVNLGTLALPSPQQLERMAAALTNQTFRTLWSIRADQAAMLPASTSASLRIVDWVPSQTAVLAHRNVKAFVSHCGANGLNEAIHAGTPIVGIPIFGDHRDLAIRVTDAGIGVWVDKRKLTTAQLRQAILAVLNDQAFDRAMARAQRAATAAGGVGRAADLIEAQASA